MSDRLAGRTALVTGVASGIGAACAARLGSGGARVAGLDMAPPPEGGPKLAAFHEVDVRDEARVAEAVAAVKEALGRIGEPAEVAAAAAFLASDDASFVSGHALVVDGGFTAGHRFGFVDTLLHAAAPGGEDADA